jgi:cytochrome P450
VEARTAIEALLERLPTLQISTAALEWLPNPAFHGVARLPAAF